MKILKKIVLALLILLVLVSIGGYLYFNEKFSPPENYLTVSHSSENIPIKWISEKDNPNSALLLPVKIQGIEKEFFMQIDFGSPITIFYKNPLQSIDTEFPKIISLNKNSGQVSLEFRIKDINISSEKFKLLDYGSKIDLKNPNADNIIGTVGTDLLEKRIVVLDFKNNSCSFIETTNENGFSEFQFKKRRIFFPVKLESQSLKLLYDTGTSGYELITDNETWEKLRIPNGKIKTEKGNSWGKELKVISAPANQKLEIGNTDLILSEVTHITGTSKIQNLLMKSSGMQGMVGNKIFLNNKIIIDCISKKFKVE